MLLVTPQRPPSFLLLPFFGTSLLLQPSLLAHFTCQCATQIAASFIPSKQRAPPPCPSLDLGFFFLSSFHFGLVCWVVVCSSSSFPNDILFSPYISKAGQTVSSAVHSLHPPPKSKAFTSRHTFTAVPFPPFFIHSFVAPIVPSSVLLTLCENCGDGADGCFFLANSVLHTFWQLKTRGDFH